MTGYLSKLEALSTTPLEEFVADDIKSAAAESYVRRSLEAAFDIGRHLLAKSGRVELASEYKSIARGLAELGVVDQDLGATLVQMAGYRNRLVHLYHLVSVEELYTILDKNLDDIRKFIRQVRDFVGESIGGR
jgi:uncharacterized protein YutE (UPF0331/DUF86 family)